MPEIANPPAPNQNNPVERIPYGISSSSDELSQTALHFIKGLHPGIGEASKLLYRTGIRVGCYYDSRRVPSFQRDIVEIAREDILPILTELVNLLTWPEGWNGYNAHALQRDAVQYAGYWILMFYLEMIALGMDWIRPNVTASGDGEVVFEWRRGVKKLTIYIGNQSAEYVEDWGPDMNAEMEDGYANSSNTRRSLWQWLMS
jgi:hypothetical protein